MFPAGRHDLKHSFSSGDRMIEADVPRSFMIHGQMKRECV